MVGQCCSGWRYPGNGGRSLPAAANCVSLRRAQWIGGLPCSSSLKQGGPWLSGMHAGNGLVPVSPASLQVHREVASVV